MKIGLAFANVALFGQPDNLVHLAQTAEQNGIESLWTVEHVVVPQGYKAKYPYSKDGRMPGPESSPIPDPFVWLSFAAAVTSKIKLATGIVILPQRHPLYVAKECATLSNLSKDRFIFGIGIGWMHDEFEALGIPFEERVGRTEESIEALRTLWKPGPSDFDGKYYSWKSLESNPKPAAGTVPIVIGGHVKAAARRAARYGDGYIAGPGSNLSEMLDEIKAECKKIGRDPAEIEITTMGQGLAPDEVKRAEDLGVSRLIVGPPAFDKEGLTKGLEQMGNAIAQL